MGGMCVSSCKYCAILNVVFCIICSLWMFVYEASGDYMMETYSSMGLVMALYVASIVTFCFSHGVEVSALSICIVLRAFVVVLSMCLLYLSLESRVSLSIFGLMFMGSVMLSIWSASCVLYSAGSGVKRVHVVLSGKINGIKTNLRNKKFLFMTHMQMSSQCRKPSAPLNQKHQNYITLSPCAPTGCTS